MSVERAAIQQQGSRLHQTESATPNSGHRLLCSGSGHYCLFLSLTHCQQHTATKQWQTAGHMVVLPASRTVHVFKFLSHVYRLPAPFSRASFGYDSRPAAEAAVTEARLCSLQTN